MMQSKAVPLIAFEAAGSSNSMGGFVFENFQAQYSRNEPFLRINGPSSTILEDLNGSFIINSPYKGPVEYNNGVDPSRGNNVDVTYTHIN
jgi:hypothetical protein